jgi:glycosyltransferase involved in cell wall biosynthesis
MKKIKNKIITIGPTTQNNKVVNGQSMMFQMLLDEMHNRNIKKIILDIGLSIFPKKRNRFSGKFSFIKSLDYIIIIIKLFIILIFNGNQTVYITTAQSKVGFIRDYFIIYLASLFGSKIIAHQFGANYSGFYNLQSKFIKKKIINTLLKVDTIIVEGDYTKKQFNFLPGFESKVYSLPNGLPEKIDTSLIQPKEIIANDPIRILYLSNMIESKGFWDVLEAVNVLINHEKLNVNAVFSGKFLESVDDKKFSNANEAKKAFFDYLEKNNLKKSVFYVEGLYGINKSKEFHKAHFFLLPSYYINEGQPVSVLEAMAYGCIPIVTQYRLIPLMVNINNGFFVNPKSPHEIVKIIKDLSSNIEKYNKFSQSTINYFLDNFTADKYTDRLISLLKI